MGAFIGLVIHRSFDPSKDYCGNFCVYVPAVLLKIRSEWTSPCLFVFIWKRSLLSFKYRAIECPGSEKIGTEIAFVFEPNSRKRRSLNAPGWTCFSETCLRLQHSKPTRNRVSLNFGDTCCASLFLKKILMLIAKRTSVHYTLAIVSIVHVVRVHPVRFSRNVSPFPRNVTW